MQKGQSRKAKEPRGQRAKRPNAQVQKGQRAKGGEKTCTNFKGQRAKGGEKTCTNFAQVFLLFVSHTLASAQELKCPRAQVSKGQGAKGQKDLGEISSKSFPIWVGKDLAFLAKVLNGVNTFGDLARKAARPRPSA